MYVFSRMLMENKNIPSLAQYRVLLFQLIHAALDHYWLILACYWIHAGLLMQDVKLPQLNQCSVIMALQRQK